MKAVFALVAAVVAAAASGCATQSPPASPTGRSAEAGLTGASVATNPAPSQPAAPSQPVSAASLVGNWEAARSDGASFAFHLAGDATYSWHYTKNGQSQQFQGAYTVADNLLILKTGGNPTMIGQITLLEANRFNFKLAGSNPSDSGLT